MTIPSSERIEIALTVVLEHTKDLNGIEGRLLKELSLPADPRDPVCQKVISAAWKILESRGLIQIVQGHAPAPDVLSNNAQDEGYRVGSDLDEPERERIDKAVAQYKYRSGEEGEAIGREGQKASRVKHPELPENHQWHRYFSYGFWAAVRPQQGGTLAEGQQAGAVCAQQLWDTDRERVEKACEGAIHNSNQEYEVLDAFSTETAEKDHPDLAKDRDWLAGWTQGFQAAWIPLSRG